MAEVPTYEIYQLSDPRDGIVRYVGFSRDANLRYQQHLRCKGKNKEKNAWIRELQTLGLKPTLSIIRLEEIECLARECEARWIWKYARRGMPLFNFMKNPMRYGDDPFMLSVEQREQIAQMKTEGQRYVGDAWKKICQDMEEEYYDASPVEIAKRALEFCEHVGRRKQSTDIAASSEVNHV